MNLLKVIEITSKYIRYQKQLTGLEKIDLQLLRSVLNSHLVFYKRDN